MYSQGLTTSSFPFPPPRRFQSTPTVVSVPRLLKCFAATRGQGVGGVWEVCAKGSCGMCDEGGEREGG